MSKVTTNVPLRAVALAVLTFLSACAGGGPPAGLASAQVAAQVPPVPPDRSRIYFYRDDDPYPSQGMDITLNGEVTGVSEAGGVFYRDMPPGKYLVATSHEPLYPHEDKTISIAGGQTTRATKAGLRPTSPTPSWSWSSIPRMVRGSSPRSTTSRMAHRLSADRIGAIARAASASEGDDVSSVT